MIVFIHVFNLKSLIFLTLSLKILYYDWFERCAPKRPSHPIFARFFALLTLYADISESALRNFFISYECLE